MITGRERWERGRRGEELVVTYLLQIGWQIVGRNVRCRGGEIDIITMDREGVLHLIEVKSGRGEEGYYRFTRSQLGRIERCWEILKVGRPELAEFPVQIDGAVVDLERGEVELLPLLTF